MPRGLPDYYNPDTLVSQRLANVEEVVTALRGAASIDNRGRTLFLDDFNENLAGWAADVDGDGAYAVISTAQSFVPPASALLDAGTSGEGGETWLMKHVHLGASALLGLEVFCWYHEDAPQYWISIHYDLSGDGYLARLAIKPSNGDIRIYTPAGFVTVGNVGYNAGSEGVWLPIKIVGDFANGAYTRVLTGQEQIDISAYSLRTSYESLPGRATYKILGFAENAVTNLAYVGHAAGTVDEP